MKSLYIYLILFLIFTIGNITHLLAQTSEKLYQKGLVKEEGEGALLEAISFYKQVAHDQNAEKALQAKALLHIGMCYEKLGKQEAVKAYQELVSNFPEQKNEVTIARERLSKLITTKSSKEITIKQVGTDYDYTASISSDGIFLAEADWGTGNVRIKNLKTGESRQVTDEGNWKEPIQYVEYTLISPDGEHVAYQWFMPDGACQLRLIKPGDAKPVVLYSGEKDDYITPELWSSDGNTIYFQKYNGKNRITQLLTVQISSKNVQMLKEGDLGSSYYGKHLSISPDNKYLAYDFPNLSDQRKYDIALLSLVTKNEIHLVKHPANDRLIGWLPGRPEFLFTSDRSGTMDIWAVNTSDLSKNEVPRRIISNSGDIDPMGYITDGSLIFQISTASFETFITPFKSDSGQISTDLQTSLSGKIFDACWLPDGEMLVGSQWIMEPDKSERLKLTVFDSRTGLGKVISDNLNIFGQLRISPDGKSILVSGIDKKRSGEKDYRGGIYTVDLETGSAEEIKVNHRITLNSCCYDWDKDGKGIYYVSDNQIIKYNFKSREEQILYNKGEFSFPNMIRSYDGRYLFADIMVDKNESDCNLLCIPLDGGEVKSMFSHKDVSSIRHKRMFLSPDGEYLYFSALLKGFRSVLYRIPASGGNPEKLWQSKNRFLVGLSIHPQGNKIALSTFTPGGEMRMIENLGNEVTRIFSQKE